MSLTDPATISNLATTLGEADAFLQSAADPTDASGTLALLGQARAQVFGQITSGDDTGASLVSAIRGIEKSLPGSVANLLVGAAQRLETYVTNTQGQKFRLYFKTGVTWTTAFRTLWRKANKEELIVRLGHAANVSGTWQALSSDATVGVDTLMEVRTATTIGAAALTIVLTLTRSAGATENVSVTIPAATPAGTVFPLPTGRRYSVIQSASITGGSPGDAIEVWIS